MGESKKTQVDKKAIQSFNDYKWYKSLIPNGAIVIEELGNDWFKWTFENNIFITHRWIEGDRGSVNHCKL